MKLFSSVWVGHQFFFVQMDGPRNTYIACLHSIHTIYYTTLNIPIKRINIQYNKILYLHNLLLLISLIFCKSHLQALIFKYPHHPSSESDSDDIESDWDDISNDFLTKKSSLHCFFPQLLFFAFFWLVTCFCFSNQVTILFTYSTASSSK